MASRYLIGKGELLTYPIDAPKKQPGEKTFPYSFDEVRMDILPKIEELNQQIAKIPSNSFPVGIAVAALTLHPAFIAKSYFPRLLLHKSGLTSVGSRTVRISPRRVVSTSAIRELDTTQLYIAGDKQAFQDLIPLVLSLSEGDPLANQLREVESIGAISSSEKIKSGEDAPYVGVYEVCLHMLPEGFEINIRNEFISYAASLNYSVNEKFTFVAGGLIFLAVEGDQENINLLANFSLVRAIRPMPSIRSIGSAARNVAVPLGITFSNSEPLSSEPKVAILDGGLPNEHALGRYVRRIFSSDPAAADDKDFNQHGLGVTSAFLFGPIKPGEQVEQPYSYVDHYRVLDATSNRNNPYELYETLGHIETILLSRQYQFINLSLGPSLPIDDHDVHAWTSVIDGILSDGETLMTVAVGNNGQSDKSTGLNRIQVPGDCVNAVAVGAADLSDSENWGRAAYSAVGPGRVPGRRKPDVVAFGGSPQDYFHVISPGIPASLRPELGTSFAAPFVLRSAVGVRAVLGGDVSPLAIKGLLIHSSHMNNLSPLDVGWGKVPSDLSEVISCDEGVARIIYQGELKPGKFLRAPVPLPDAYMQGNVTLKATFCYASPIDPQDVAAYTKAGLVVTFRPHAERIKEGAINAISKTFFPVSEYKSEAELRSDLGKWETILHAENTYRASSLHTPVFDIHYNAREGAGTAGNGSQNIRYALIITIVADKHPNLHDEILGAHTVLKAIVPTIPLPTNIKV